jgi:hypothetical protein
MTFEVLAGESHGLCHFGRSLSFPEGVRLLQLRGSQAVESGCILCFKRTVNCPSAQVTGRVSQLRQPCAQPHPSSHPSSTLNSFCLRVSIYMVRSSSRVPSELT